MGMNYNQGLYDKINHASGAKAADGLSGLAGMAAMAGNDLSLHQGHGELTESFRVPLHPGHYGNRDDLRQADYIGKEYASGGMTV